MEGEMKTKAKQNCFVRGRWKFDLGAVVPALGLAVPK